jgi:hypothetical protein
MVKICSSGGTRYIQEGGLDVEERFLVYLIAGFNSDGLFFHLGTPEQARLRSSSQDYRRFRGKIWGNSDVGGCQRIKACSRQCRATHCRLLWNGRRLLRTLTVTTVTGIPFSGVVRVQPGRRFNKNNNSVCGEGFESLTALHKRTEALWRGKQWFRRQSYQQGIWPHCLQVRDLRL